MSAPAIKFDDGGIKSKLRFDPEFGKYVPVDVPKGGRKGMDGLFDLVSSKNARDITRKSDWIANKPFEEWNERDIARNDGKQRYWGRLEDYDKDGLNEFVVRRGEDEDAPIIAVNGYTTKKSDYPWKFEYYDECPNPAARKEKSFRSFLNEKYEPEYGEDHMSVTKYKLDPETDKWTQQVKQRGYSYPVPVSRTPYQAFSEIIVHPAIKDFINTLTKGNKDRAKEIRKEIALKSGHGPGFASILCAKIYNHYITNPVIRGLESNGQIDEYEQMYITKKKATNPNFEYNEESEEDQKKFLTWVKSRKEIKQTIKNLAAKYLTGEEFDQTYAEIKDYIDSKLTAVLRSR